jgi:hypothetical protein
VLRTPQWAWGHAQFTAADDELGGVAVHTAEARDGLLVTSVAARPGVPAAAVLAAAGRLASAIATFRPVARRSLFDLPLGAAPLWKITERKAEITSSDGRAEDCTAVLPAWSADSTHDPGGHPGLGFGAVAATLAALAGMDQFGYEARQAAVARYSRTGFEAAAVTALGLLAGPGPRTPAGCAAYRGTALRAALRGRRRHHRPGPARRAACHQCMAGPAGLLRVDHPARGHPAQPGASPQAGTNPMADDEILAALEELMAVRADRPDLCSLRVKRLGYQSRPYQAATCAPDVAPAATFRDGSRVPSVVCQRG